MHFKSATPKLQAHFIHKPSRTAILITIGCLTAVLFLTAATAAHADSNNGLTTINNPAGGQVVYGSMTNVTSQRDAIAAMLRYIHGHFGDRPQIGKFFQTKGSDSIATFFQLTARNQGNKPVAGMVIVEVAPGAKTGAAAVLYDDAARFAKTQPALMSKLNAAWHVENAKLVSAVRATGGSNASSGSGSTPRGANARGNGPGGVFGTNEPATSSQRLHLARNGDNSGSIGIPDGWRITGGSGGSIAAEGPKGESMAMGILNQNIYDPNTQQGSSMISYLRRGSTPFSVCPYSLDLAADYLCVSTQQRQRRHLPAISMHVLSTRLSPGHPSEGAMLAEVDFHDGKGVMLSSIRAGAQRQGPGSWTLTISQVNEPRDIADGEWSTIAGMIMTYRQNAAVIQGETQQVINQINATAHANQVLADARGQANDTHNAQVDATWDQQARQNKAFENYTLDYSVLHDPSDGGSYGRATYPTADWLVKAAPDRFQIAATQDLLKGIDY
jgi:hypothetical protein